MLAQAAERLILKARLFQGFSDPSRLAILEALCAGPLTVSTLVEKTGLPQPNVSSHLAYLRSRGLVTCVQQGRRRHYQLSDTRVASLLGLAKDLLADIAQGV